MLVVAGLSLKNLKPRVWDPSSPYHIPHLQAVMVSYAEVAAYPARARAIEAVGLRDYIGVPNGVKIYLDNGAFYFLSRNGEILHKSYEEFVTRAQPDWWPIPHDFIPTPAMTDEEQRDCLKRTMALNRAYEHDGYVPVIHAGHLLES